MNHLITCGVAIAAVVAIPVTARAQSFADVTGGNVWNNYAPIFAPEDLDPDLLARIDFVNREAPVAYQACDRAVVALQQNTDVPRRYARPDSPYRIPAPPLPQECARYSDLVGEADSLRRIVAEIEQSRLNPNFYTW
jgi:hypothetical protein